MGTSLISVLANDLGFELYPIPNDPYHRCFPQKDDALADCFRECNFTKIDHLLATFADGNQNIFLSETLIDEIIQSQMENVLSNVIKRSRYDLLFDQKLSGDQKAIILSLKDNGCDWTSLSESDKRDITLSELKKDFKSEFEKETEVSLLWVAVFLKRVDLVSKLLLSAKKPADMYCPFTRSDLNVCWELDYLCSINDWYSRGLKYITEGTIKIIRVFLEAGVDIDHVLFGNSNFFSILAVELNNIELMKLLLEYPDKVSVNYQIPAEAYPIHIFSESREILEKIPTNKELSPLLIAVYKQNAEMVSLLIENGASTEGFTAEENRLLRKLNDPFYFSYGLNWILA